MAAMQVASGTFDFLQDRRRLLAILLTSLAGTAVLVFLVARGELAGADARAYWGGVRVWLDGGSPMAPPDRRSRVMASVGEMRSPTRGQLLRRQAPLRTKGV
jgi:hypothetical protein